MATLGIFLQEIGAITDPVLYSAFDRELLACCAGIRHFWFLLEGRPFTIYTNHKSLTQPWARWLMGGKLCNVGSFLRGGVYN